MCHVYSVCCWVLVVCNQSLEIYDKDMAAMLDENTLQIQ